MTDDRPIFHSPITWTNLENLLFDSPTQLTLADLTGIPITLIQGEAGEYLKQRFANIPAQPGDLINVGDGLLARLTLIEFYLFGRSPAANLPSAAELDHHLSQAQTFAHATDLTHGQAVLKLSGLQAAELLSKICGLDFYGTVFPNRRVAQTSAAKIKTLIARDDEGDTPTYFLHVDRPSGQYFWEMVWDAGQEFGISRVAALRP